MKNNEPIDYSDIPETTDEFWAGAQIHLGKNTALQTLKLDAEIINWFKEEWKNDYQAQINAVLRAYVTAHSKKVE